MSKTKRNKFIPHCPRCCGDAAVKPYRLCAACSRSFQVALHTELYGGLHRVNERERLKAEEDSS